MDCPLSMGRTSAEATGIFVEFCARTLAPAEQSALAQHLESCSDCRRIVAAQREVWSALDQWTPAGVGVEFDAMLYSKIAAEGKTPWWKRVMRVDWSWKPAMPVAVACATLLAAFLLKSPVPEYQSQAGLQPGVLHSVQTRIDIEQVERALDDIDMLKQIGVTIPSTSGTAVRSEKL